MTGRSARAFSKFKAAIGSKSDEVFDLERRRPAIARLASIQFGAPSILYAWLYERADVAPMP